MLTLLFLAPKDSRRRDIKYFMRERERERERFLEPAKVFAYMRTYMIHYLILRM